MFAPGGILLKHHFTVVKCYAYQGDFWVLCVPDHGEMRKNFRNSGEMTKFEKKAKYAYFLTFLVSSAPNTWKLTMFLRKKCSKTSQNHFL